MSTGRSWWVRIFLGQREGPGAYTVRVGAVSAGLEVGCEGKPSVGADVGQ